MTFVIPYPSIDPVLVSLGPIVIRWYALAYVAGLLLGWRYMLRLGAKAPQAIEPRHVDDFLVWATLGVVLGGRLGHVLFYAPDYYFSQPMEILRVWKGGMSFHGGILGVTVAGLLFVRQRKLDALVFADILSCAAPIGLFFGRIANFINGELWGRPTDVPWAMIFPRGGPVPRHPSQLYEAALEGLVLFLLANFLWRNETVRNRPGMVAGAFIGGYGLVRSLSEFTREPDGWVGPLTTGQALSTPMVLIGLYLVMRAKPLKR